MISKFNIKILKTNIEADPSKIDEICNSPYFERDGKRDAQTVHGGGWLEAKAV